MAKRFDSITPELQRFIEEQPLFFVASAPLAADGHINLSPKGLDTLRVLGPQQIAYLDLTGSGNETAAHLNQNGRLTLMFCAFSNRPQILRVYCRGRVVLRGSEEWDRLLPLFPEYPGRRQIIVGDVVSVQTSCGYAVPKMEWVGERDTLQRWAEAKGETGLAEYWSTRNTASLDGLPAPMPDSGIRD